MKSLKKILLGLLLIGVSINLDLNAMKRSRPFADALEYRLKADSRASKVSRRIEEQDVAGAMTDQESDDDAFGPDEVMPQAAAEIDPILPAEEDDLFFQPANELPGDLNEMIIPVAPEAQEEVLVDQQEVEHGFIKLPRGFTLENLKAYLTDKAIGGALVVYSGSDIIGAYLPVGGFYSPAITAAVFASKCAYGYLVYRGGKWVLNNPSARRFVRAKRERLAQVITSIGSYLRNIFPVR